MEKLRKKTIIVGAILALFAAFRLFAGSSVIQSNIASGVYIPKKNLTVNELKTMPIPKTGEDYVFINSQGKVTSVVIGNFKYGDRKITLIQDRDGDGKVDIVAHWFVDKKRYRYESKPQKLYDQDAFKKLIINILYGKGNGINPNPEGINYLKLVAENPDNVSRWKNGHSVILRDVDDNTSQRLRYYFANNGVRGYDLVFEVNYENISGVRISPIINQAVYCYESFNPLIAETVNELTKYILEHSPVK